MRGKNKNSAVSPSLCVFCVKPASLENSSSGIEDNDKVQSLLDNEAKTIFIVQKLLGLSQEISVDILRKFGNPSSWIEICWACQDMVDGAKTIHDRINQLERSLHVLRNDARKKVKDSHKNNAARISGAALEIRTAVLGGEPELELIPNKIEVIIPEVQEFEEVNLGPPSPGSNFITEDSDKVEVFSNCGDDPNYSPLGSQADLDDEEFTPESKKRNAATTKSRKRRGNDVSGSVVVESKRKKTKTKQETDYLEDQSDLQDDEDEGETENLENKKRKAPARPLKELEIEQCPYCTYRFLKGNLSIFMEHMTKLHYEIMCRDKLEKGEEVSITCDKCLETSFETAEDLLTHRIEVHSMIKCDICLHTVIARGYLQRHTKKYHSEETAGEWTKIINRRVEAHRNRLPRDPTNKNKCKYCDKAFNHRKFLSKHCIKDHPEKMLKCDYDECSNSNSSLLFHTLGQLYAHKVSVHKEPNDPYKCRLCDYASRKYFQVEKHKLTVHTERLKLLCEVCSKEYYTEKTLLWHKIKDHGLGKETGEKFALLQCKHTNCGRIFSSPHYLRVHERNVHLKASLYPCPYEQCSVSFAGQKQLDLHISVVHMKQSRFACPVEGCTKKCGTRGGLKEHMIRAHGEKKHKCPYCDYVTADTAWFKTHIGIHEKGDSRPYQCSKCGKGFVSFRYLIQHCNSHIKKGEMDRSERPSFREYKWKLQAEAD